MQSEWRPASCKVNDSNPCLYLDESSKSPETPLWEIELSRCKFKCPVSPLYGHLKKFNVIRYLQNRPEITISLNSQFKPLIQG